MPMQDKETRNAYARAHYAQNKDAYHRQYRAWSQSDKGRWSKYTRRAKRDNLPWSLSREQFSVLVNEPCEYCGTPGPGGIDRVNNDNGYILENTVPCCFKCNWMKRHLSYGEFLAHIFKIAERH